MLRNVRSLFLLHVFLVASPNLVAAERPNVLMILVDDLGYGDLSCFGAADLESPAIDALAAKGMTFRNFYANCPVCSPTRASLMTGRYPELAGVPGVIRTHAEDSWGYLRPDCPTLPETLSSSGYETALIGKWHLGLDEESHPLSRGFDFFHGFLGDMMDDYYTHRRHGRNYMRRNGKEIDPEGHASDLFTDWACDYLKSRASASKPFFLYLAYNAPHTPIQPPQDWVVKIRTRQPGMSEKRAKLVALIEHMDDGISRVLNTLQRVDLERKTLIIFSSDNGGQISVGANNGSTRSGKGTMYEGGIKVPTIAVWPGKVEPRTESERMAMTMDLFPTICEAAEIPVPSTSIDGESFLPTLLGRSQATSQRNLFWIRREGGVAYGGLNIRAVRSGDWKLVHNSPYGPLELFHLGEDPLEKNDLSKKRPKQFRQIAAILRRHIQRGGAVPWQRAGPIDSAATDKLQTK